MAVRDHSAAPRRRWPLIVVPLVIAATAAAGWSLYVGADTSDTLVAAGLGAAAGLLLGLVVAWIVGVADSTLRSPRQIGKATGVTNLAVVPRHPIGATRPDDVSMLRDPNSIESEAYRTARTALEVTARSTPARGDRRDRADRGDGPTGATVFVVTSPRPGEGKSSVCANLAAAAAMAGKRVVMIDGDMRKPQAHRLFGMRNQIGLSSVLQGTATVAEAVQRLDLEPNLAVLPAGPPPSNPAELLADERLERTVSGLAAAADLVLIDAPPVLPVADPMILMQHADAALLVATIDLSNRREWAEAMRRLEVVDAAVVGTIVLSPDDRVQAFPTYRYAPTARPEDWWVSRSAGGRSSADGPSDEGASDGHDSDGGGSDRGGSDRGGSDDGASARGGSNRGGSSGATSTHDGPDGAHEGLDDWWIPQRDEPAVAHEPAFADEPALGADSDTSAAQPIDTPPTGDPTPMSAPRPLLNDEPTWAADPPPSNGDGPPLPPPPAAPTSGRRWRRQRGKD